MVGRKKETAEQKLLKMIEASTGAGYISSNTQQNVKQKQNLLTVIRLVNGFLILTIVIGVGLVFLQIKTGTETANQKISFSSPVISTSTMERPSALMFGSLDSYLSYIQKRNLFYPYEKPQVTRVAEGATKNSAIMQLARSLRLVGVSWLDTPESASVMLEDTEKGNTYFLMKGEKIGDIFVKTIYADSVQLGYQNEEIVLRYDTTK